MELRKMKVMLTHYRYVIVRVAVSCKYVCTKILNGHIQDVGCSGCVMEGPWDNALSISSAAAFSFASRRHFTSVGHVIGNPPPFSHRCRIADVVRYGL